MVFKNRRDAGRKLASRLVPLKLKDPVVVALPRGGVPVAYEVARELQAPLDVLVAKKLGAPGNPELAIGAVAEDGEVWINDELTRYFRLTDEMIDEAVSRKRQEILEQEEELRGERRVLDLEDRTVILVDDGLATGATALAAIQSARSRNAAKVIVAVPVYSPSSAKEVLQKADEVISVVASEDLRSVGQWYEDFDQVTSGELQALLESAFEEEESEVLKVENIILNEGGVRLLGEVAVPDDAKGWVLFAHGSGSSHRSPRNLSVARYLNDSGFATLLFDLLTEEEAKDRANVFNIELLTERLLLATRWVNSTLNPGGLPIGYFGASTGAAAALRAAGDASLRHQIFGVVARGGRVDLACDRLPQVEASVLLIVGDQDEAVLDLNKKVEEFIRDVRLELIPGAGHLFEEPGAMEAVEEKSASFMLECLEGLEADLKRSPTQAPDISDGERPSH